MPIKVSKAERNMKSMALGMLASARKQDQYLYNVEGKLVKARKLKKLIKLKGSWGLA